MATILRDETRCCATDLGPESTLASTRALVWRRRAAALMGAAVAFGALAVAIPATRYAVPGDVTIDQADQQRQRLQQQQAEVAAQLDAAKATSEQLINA